MGCPLPRFPHTRKPPTPGARWRLCIGAEKGFNADQLSLLSSPDFDFWQLGTILRGLESGLSVEQVKTYARPTFDAGQMDQILLGLQEGLANDELSLYASSSFDAAQMAQIRKGLGENIPLDHIRVFANPHFETKQMEQILRGFEQRLSLDEVLTYALPDLTWYEMKKQRRSLGNGKARKGAHAPNETDDQPDERMFAFSYTKTYSKRFYVYADSREAAQKFIEDRIESAGGIPVEDLELAEAAVTYDQSLTENLYEHPTAIMEKDIYRLPSSNALASARQAGGAGIASKLFKRSGQQNRA